MAEPDFSGWATKNDLRCSDGRVIRHDAFMNNDGKRVPLVWQHGHGNIQNVIGHAELENRPNGVYARGFLNSTPQADVARDLLLHGDINSMSIFANKLKQQGQNVMHGNIVEVSLVLSPANPGALIENVTIQHSDGSYEDDETEAVITSGIQLDEEVSVANAGTKNKDEMTHADSEGTPSDTKSDNTAPASAKSDANTTQKPKSDDEGETLQDVFDTLNEKQKNVVYAMLAMAAGSSADESNSNSNSNSDSDSEGDKNMAHSNVFEGNGAATMTGVTTANGTVLSHAEVQSLADDIVDFAMDNKLTLKDAIAHAAKDYGISNVEELFPNAKVNGTPTWVKPEDGWVPEVLDSTSQTPFARLKSTQIDLTEEKLRAKGYITADQKKDGVFKVLNRETTPQTVYIRSKLDRDDIIDVTEHDIVAFTKEAMRIKFRYELARAILVGDGRAIDDREKIQESHIRPIYSEDDFYAAKVVLPNTVTNVELSERVLRAQKNFKGHGVPTLFTTFDVYMDLLLAKDEKDSYRRLYKTDQELCAALHVNKIVVVDELEGVNRTTDKGKQELVGILVNMIDYNIGRDKGGEIFNAEDFDIDFNQYKYLMETRLSGALTEPKTAIVIERLAA